MSLRLDSTENIRLQPQQQNQQIQQSESNRKFTPCGLF